jgi:cytochrome c553
LSDREGDGLALLPTPRDLNPSDPVRTLLLAGCALFCGLMPAFADLLAERLPACLACHGETGRSETPEVPSLGGQPSSFVLIQLYQFREKQRVVEIMNEMTKDMTDEDLRSFAEKIAELPPPPPASDAADRGRMERASGLSSKHRCGFCHNPDYSGHDQIPRLAGQREDYLVKAMGEYKSGVRTGYDPAMVEIAKALEESEIVELAYFLANWR